MFEEIKARRKPDGRCPQCGRRQREVRLDLDACELECTHCQARFSPTMVFTDRQILTRFQHLPVEAQEILFGALGFEGRPPRRTSTILFYGFWGAMLLGMIIAATGCIVSGQAVAQGVLLLVVLPEVCFQIWKIRKNQAGISWQRKGDDCAKGKEDCEPGRNARLILWGIIVALIVLMIVIILPYIGILIRLAVQYVANGTVQQ